MLRQKHITAAIRATVALLVLLFASYYVSTTMFWHGHIVNGTVVIHSHMHAESHHSSEDGGHSEPSIITIDSLHSQLLTFGSEPETVALLAAPIVVELHAGDVPVVVLPVYSIRTLRAPPAATELTGAIAC